MIAGFEFGSRAPLHVRHERVVVPVDTTAAWRIIYASDLHLTARRQHVGAALVDVVSRNRPDAVLLGGDLLDRRSGAEVLSSTVEQLARHARVFAVAGNHDDGLGRECARAAVRAGGGHWLHDGEGELQLGRARMQLHGAVRARNASDADCVRALVGHNPRIVESAAQHYDIVFAGHLHGGQCVWWNHGGRLYPGAWFSRWNGLRFAVRGAVLLVSRGVADTFPARFRCLREVVCCEVTGSRAESVRNRAIGAPEKKHPRDMHAGARFKTPATTYFLARQYHRRLLLDDRVRNGNGYGQEPMITGSTSGAPKGAP